MKLLRTLLLLILAVVIFCGAGWAQPNSNVRLLGQLNLQTIPECYAWDVAVQGNYAYVAGAGSGLQIIDVSNPAAPVRVGSFNTPGFAQGIAVSGNYAYVADGYGWYGLRAINVSNPAAPVAAGAYTNIEEAWAVALRGSHVFVTDYFEGVRILSIANPAVPTSAGYWDGPGDVWEWCSISDVAVSGNYMYVATGRGLRIVNIVNIANPYTVGTWESTLSISGVAASGNYAYVTNNGQLRILDVSNPAVPVALGSCAGGTKVAVVGNYAYVVGSGLRVIDISTPAAPVQVGYYNTPGEGKNLAVVGNRVHAANYQYFGIYDCAAALCGGTPSRGGLQLVQSGPANWGYRLEHVQGCVTRLVFTNFCSGTTARISGAATADWTVMAGGDGNDGDSIIFAGNWPLTAGTLDTFWLSHPSCAYHVDWCVGDSCGSIDGPLPVELLDFTATSGDGEVTLAWRTASERDNARFEVARDGLTIASVNGQGNSAREQRYTWTDAGLANGRVYLYTLFSVSTGGERAELQQAEAVPTTGAAAVTEYALHAAYPNPFNPATTIAFDLPEAGPVRLTVYDLLGQEVAGLASGMQSAGRHVVTFDASALPSGMYLYRLEAGSFRAVEKMLLLK